MGLVVHTASGTFEELVELSAPATPPANRLRIYAKDKAGVSTLYYKQDDGTEVELGAGGPAADHGTLSGLGDDDHPQYATDTDLSNHVAAADPHTGYRLESADHSHQSTGAQAGQLDHGLALTGLTDDDHTQYIKEKASGGAASEIPEHTHASVGEAGTIDHGVLTGLTDDDHTQYQKESEKSAANGYASLDGSTLVPIAELPTGTGAAQVALGNHSHVGGSSFTEIVATADQDVTNNTNQDHTVLQFSVTANAFYLVEVLLSVSGNNTTGDFECRFAVSAGTMNGRGTYLGFTTADAISTAVMTAAAAASSGQVACGTAADLNVPIAIHMVFAFRPSNSTTFKLQFGNNAAAAGRTSRVLKGSVMKWKQSDA